MKVSKAVIPAAGFGTRFLPATQSQPKEMLPVGRKPVVQHVVEELARGFVEFRPYLGHCRFHNCRHLKEPGCAVQAAARDGAISRQRVENYQALVATMGRPE